MLWSNTFRYILQTSVSTGTGMCFSFERISTYKNKCYKIKILLLMDFMYILSQKHKNPKEMSSPKRKAYFKSFLKLWNKRKLPQVKDRLNGNLIHIQDFCYFFTWSHHSYTKVYESTGVCYHIIKQFVEKSLASCKYINTCILICHILFFFSTCILKLQDARITRSWN